MGDPVLALGLDRNQLPWLNRDQFLVRGVDRLNHNYVMERFRSRCRDNCCDGRNAISNEISARVEDTPLTPDVGLGGEPSLKRAQSEKN